MDKTTNFCMQTFFFKKCAFKHVHFATGKKNYQQKMLFTIFISSIGKLLIHFFSGQSGHGYMELHDKHFSCLELNPEY